MILLSLLPLVLCISLFLTFRLRKYALANSLIDVPNNRSSHVVPTPRGGGVSIVLSFMLLLPVLGYSEVLSWHSIWALLGAGAGVAIIGFLDDHGHIAARWRLLGHFGAAAWVLFWLGGLAPITLFGVTVDLGWLGSVLAVLYLVWMLNLYNFMDGIDGLASLEAISVCIGAALLYWLSGSQYLIWAPLLLAFAVAGFLYWNFPPARIFMGDAGSGFLGIVLGTLSLQGAWEHSDLFWGWLILLGAFIVDATVTLIHRLLRREKVYEAHRSHAYQFASRRYGAHLPVTITVGLINLLWLLPIAILVVIKGVDGLVGLVLAYTPLIFLALKFKAGAAEAR
jgi:Fuc2NAc and GlcNAc transferase